MKKIFNRIELSLFLTFIITYSLLIQWNGWNEDSRFALIRSIVEDTEIQIDEYANITGDRSFYNNHYYSDKAPGQSILGVPFYFIRDFIHDNLLKSNHEKEQEYVEDPQYGVMIYELINPSPKTLVSRILVTIILSSLSGALLIILIYKTVKIFTGNIKLQILVSIIFGLGTLIFPYSTVLNGNILATLFGFLSFYIILKTETGKRDLNNRNYFLAGVLSGFSIVIDYTMIFVFSALVFFVLLNKKFKQAFILLFGCFLGLIPLLVYNFAIFNNPFIITMFHVDSVIFPCVQKQFEYCEKSIGTHFNFSSTLLMFIPVLLFSPYRGLLFYHPLLLFSFIDLYLFYKKNKNITPLLILLFLEFILFNTFLLDWWSGATFGLRHLTPLMPFLSIPIIFFIEKTKENKLLYILFIIFVSISIFHNILGQSTSWEEPIIKKIGNDFLYLIYWYDIEFFTNRLIVLNPLYQHYLPAFLDHGPISSITHGVFVVKVPDIQYNARNNVGNMKYYETFLKFGSNMLVVKSEFITLYIILLLIFLIWMNFLKFDLKIIGIIIFIMIFVLFFVSIKPIP